MMDEREIINYLWRFKGFRGVFACDEVLNLEPLALHSGIVVNTERRSGRGEHWVAVYRGTIPLYFDSFGNGPFQTQVIRYLYRMSPDGWLINTKDFQSIYQDSCGHYCLYFLASMFATNGDFGYFESMFSQKPEINDILAKILYKLECSEIN